MLATPPTNVNGARKTRPGFAAFSLEATSPPGRRAGAEFFVIPFPVGSPLD